MTPFLLALALIATVPLADPSEPEPLTILHDCGPVIDRAEAARIGLFRYRQNFGALRFVRADSGRLEARIATSMGGVMLEQAVPLDSLGLGRVTQGLQLLRDRGATNVELLLSPSQPLNVACLGPATDARARAGALCLGLLGVSAGATVAMHTAVDYAGTPYWREPLWNKPAYLVMAATGGLLGGLGGWLFGSHADAGRPVEPQPHCAIAAHDDNGYPIYEEQVRQVLESQSTVHLTFGGLVISGIASVIASNAIASSYWARGHDDMGFVGQFPTITSVFATIAAGTFVSNTIGRDMDRRVALEKLRNRPRPEPTRPPVAAQPPAIGE